jgi:LmbE family N-acetylglucosaminyl deacetylase
MKLNRVCFIIATIFLCFFSVTQVQAKILIVAPHPDDDLITSAGVIARAVARGEAVRVVYMTNGDYLGVSNGYLRQGEAVSGESILGIPEDNLIFLGYPDGYLDTIFTSYVNADDQYMSPNEVTATYGNRGLGSADYHFYRFGSHADYNRYNILMDLADIISSYLPDHILVTSEFDILPDHATTYQLVRLAVSSVNSGNPGYHPVIHKTIVHWADSSSTVTTWPDPLDPTAYITALPAVSDTGSTWAETGLSWSDRESIDVPLTMQSTDYAVNPKYLAISEHTSQGGVYQLLGWFIHKDEIFWAENTLGANHPPIVNAGLDQTVTQGQGSGIVQLDGSQSRDPDGDQLTFQWVQRSGPAVALSDPTSASPSFTVPAGLTQNEVLTFELVVSDGQFTTIPDSVSVTVQVQP